MAKIGLILSGCGVYDGSEIHEATLTAYFIDKLGLETGFLSPSGNQLETIDHSKQEITKETRNCLIESARIARGIVTPLSEANTKDYDAVIISGGYGAAKNLSSYAADQTNLTIEPETAAFLLKMHAERKALGFICIASVIAAKLFPGTELTLGLDQASLDNLDTIGAVSRQANYDDVVVDNDKKIYSTPAYMTNASISQIALGIEKIVHYIYQTIDVAPQH